MAGYPRLEALLEDSFDLSSLLGEYRDEALQQLEELDAALLTLEEDATLPEERVSSLLRGLHTLKGNSGMIGLRPVVAVLHALEGVFRAGTEELPRQRLDLLFETAAALRQAVERIGSDQQDAALARLQEHGLAHRLERVAGPETVARPSGGSADEAAAGRSAEPDGPADSAGEFLRVPFEHLDRLLDQVGELTSIGASLDALAAGLGGPHDAAAAQRRLQEEVERLARMIGTVRDSTMQLRLVPVQRVFSRFPSLARELAREQGKQVRVVLEGGEVELDKTTVDALADPLLHLVRNAVDHGIRTPEEREAAGKPAAGTIRLRAERHGDEVRVEVGDDGSGLDRAVLLERARATGLVGPDEVLSPEETLALIFRPGFSTRTETDTVSGRGIGLDVVKRRVTALRGSLRVEDRPDGGTRFVLELPLTLLVLPALLFEAAGEVLALPTTEVEETLRRVRPERAGAAEVIRHRGEVVPVVRLERLLGWSPAGEQSSGSERFALVLRQGSRRTAVLAERVLDQRDLVVKALPPYLGSLPAVSGASVAPDGRVILLLDAEALLELSIASYRRDDRGRHAS